MTENEIKKLSSEKISKMKLDEAKKTLQEANRYAKKLRDKALEQVRANPELPKPTIFREYGNGNRHEFENWETYDFTTPRGATLNQIRHKLDMVVGFMNAKTLDYDKWTDTLQEFAQGVAGIVTKDKRVQSTGRWNIRDKKGRFISKKNYIEFMKTEGEYVKMWDIFNKLSEIKDFKAFGYDSTQIQELIYSTMIQHPDMSVDELVRITNDKIQGIDDEELTASLRDLEEQIGW